MLSVSKENILDIVENAKFDQSVGIKFSMLWEDSARSYYCASIFPDRSISAHFHNEGDELYFIISGNGVMRLGIPLSTGVEWAQSFDVCCGDVFTVPPKTVHQLTNKSDDSLILVFGCKKSHLGNDRIIIDS